MEIVEGAEDDLGEFEDLSDEILEDLSPEEIGESDEKPAYPSKYGYQTRSWLHQPDVLGYLNSFRELDDPARQSLARACVNFLAVKIKSRRQQETNRAEWRSRAMARGPVNYGTPYGASSKKPGALKRTKSMREMQTKE